jgi:RNA polymerase sigma-70 factor (ECF subfamily)
VQPEDVRAALERRFRSSESRIVAALTRRFGAEHLELAENAAQDAYLRALERWPADGQPDDAERWLVRVAHNVMIDALRRERAIEPLNGALVLPEEAPTPDADDEIRLMFLCCDPVLTRAAQIALVLNVAFGLTARQIATAFVTEERTVAQRIVRAKQRLREQGVRFDMPSSDALPARLDAILDVLYLVFSEGYNPTEGMDAIDVGSCNEALRFIRLLTDKEETALPVAFALRALMCFHVSRVPARLADDGSLLLLQEQDRTQWDSTLIAEAFECLGRAASGSELTRLHLEAAIAACHAVAPTFATADWTRIVELYDMLRERGASVVIDVNRAIAVAMQRGAREGLDELDAIPDRDVIARYPYALAAYADLHASLGNLEEARSFLDRALMHQSAPAQAALLRRKRAALARRVE